MYVPSSLFLSPAFFFNPLLLQQLGIQLPGLPATLKLHTQDTHTRHIVWSLYWEVYKGVVVYPLEAYDCLASSDEPSDTQKPLQTHMTDTLHTPLCVHTCMHTYIMYIVFHTCMYVVYM